VGASQESLSRSLTPFTARGARKFIRRCLVGGSDFRRQLKIGFEISVVAY